MDRITLWQGIGASEYVPELIKYAEALDEQAGYEAVVNAYCDGDNSCLQTLEKLAESAGVHKYSADFILVTDGMVRSYAKYKDLGFSDAQFFENMRDLKYKLDECRTVYGVTGTFVAWWNHGWLDATRFKLGRFQYERAEFDCDEVVICGIKTQKGDRVFNFHIPSSGEDMGESARLASYKQAYDFFKNELPSDGVMRIVCRSWLLWSGLKEMLGEKSNIRSFASDFTLIKEGRYEAYGDYWRVFGKDFCLPPDKLPRNNSLRRGVADMIARGESMGWGYGLILFDGEKIIR